MNKRPRYRHLFEIDNARNLTRDELVTTFVPTKTFRRLLSSKNHIILGSRGSGKTALVKMLAHDHLSQLHDEQAQQVIASKSFIGIYVPTRIEWVGGLKNKPWQTEKEKEEFFQWRLNISTCLALLVTAQSCLNTYVHNKVDRALAEESLAEELSKSWSEHTFNCKTIKELQAYLENVEYRKQQQLARMRIEGKLRLAEEHVGLGFETDLFSPLRMGITLISRLLNFPDETAWLVCLDEAEFLEKMHHRILNSYLRSYSGNLAFKITTMPYRHYTLATNTDVPLNVGQDFEYVYIDRDPMAGLKKGNDEGQFAKEIFDKRAAVSTSKYHNIKLSTILGKSYLLEPKKSNWTRDSREMKLLLKFGDAKTVRRALRLIKTPKQFADQISRKIHSALFLREAIASLKGRMELDCYSGDLMAIRCGDGNPRRLIRIFNSLLLEAKWKITAKGKKVPVKLSNKEQTRILTSFSSSTLSRVQSEMDFGPQLYRLIDMIGNFMRNELHDGPLTTDQMSSIRIDNIDDETWQLIEGAVGLGLLYPNISTNNPDQMPYKDGTFHLAYVLAPHFKILPRRGKAVKLSSLLKQRDILKQSADSSQEQLKLKLQVRG